MNSHKHLLFACELRHRLRISRTTFWRMQKAGELPLPLKVSKRSMWRLTDIKEWENRPFRSFYDVAERNRQYEEAERALIGDAISETEQEIFDALWGNDAQDADCQLN